MIVCSEKSQWASLIPLSVTNNRCLNINAPQLCCNCRVFVIKLLNSLKKPSKSHIVRSWILWKSFTGRLSCILDMLYVLVYKYIQIVKSCYENISYNISYLLREAHTRNNWLHKHQTLRILTSQKCLLWLFLKACYKRATEKRNRATNCI